MEDSFMINKNLVIFGLIGLGILLIVVIDRIDSYRRRIKAKSFEIETYLKLISERDKNINAYEHLTETQKLEFEKAQADIKLNSQQWAFNQFEKFKSNELESIKKVIEENAIKAAANLFQEWKNEHTSKIRQDAVNRSYSVNLGKITEHLVPFHTKFPFDPRDARFMGSPIDLIVFDGLTEDEELLKVYFVEIKTGKSRLNERQKKIKSAVQNKRVEWHEINVDSITE